MHKLVVQIILYTWSISMLPLYAFAEDSYSTGKKITNQKNWSGAGNTWDTSKTLLAIFPHPDDESAIAEVLISYRQMGYKVQVVIATDGKDGTRVTKIPAGDSLGALRKDETRCACKMMGIEPPIFLGVERLDTKIGVGKYFAAHEKSLGLLKNLIDSLKPNFIITFGPDGDTHHSEHIVMGATVTELLLMENWVDKYPLYYLAWSEEQGKLFELGYVHKNFRNVEISYSQEVENDALRIMTCYPTQYLPEELVTDREKKLKDLSNRTYFRRFVVKKGMQKGF